MSDQFPVPTGQAPTQKMVDEAINWTGPWLDKQTAGQQRMYVSVLRRFAMAAVMHPDYLMKMFGTDKTKCEHGFRDRHKVRSHGIGDAYWCEGVPE